MQLHQEITDRKATEIALQEQKSVLNTIFDHAPIPQLSAPLRSTDTKTKVLHS